MKLIIVLSFIACSYAAKLDRTYLPPSNAATAGGSPGSLRAPSGGFGGNGGLGQAPSAGFGQPEIAKSAPSGFGQSGSAGFGPASGPSSFGQSTAPSGFGQTGSGASGYGQQSATAGFAQIGAGAAGKQAYEQGSSAGFGQAPSTFDQNQGFSGQRSQQPERPQASADRNAENLKFESQNDGETFSYNFETSNGISAEESGVATNGVQAQGGYSYTGDDGQFYRVSYTADENGYVPQGDHLPTPHPIPAEIMKSIEENARAAAAGTQEGAYRPEEEDSRSPQQYNAGATSQGQSQGYNYNQPQGGQTGQQGSYNQGSNAGFVPLGGRTSNQQGPASQFGTSAQGPAGQYSQGSSAPQGFGTSRTQGQVSRVSQDQGESGYEYNRPQAGASQGRPSQAGPSPFNRPSGQSQPSGSFPTGPAAAKSAFGPSSGSNQGSFGPSSGSSQGSFGPSGSSQGSFGPSGAQQYNRPEQNVGPAYSRPGSAGSSGSNQGAFGPSSSQSSRPKGSNAGQGGFGSSANLGAFGLASSQGSRPGSQGSQYQGSAAGRTSMPIQAPYQYNRPGSAGQLGQSSLGSQGQSGQGQSGQGQTFGGPRQPPSFSEQEGYKY